MALYNTWHLPHPGVEGFRLDIMSNLTRTWMPYSSPRNPLTHEMAEALFDHLVRSDTTVRLVEVSTGRALKSWNNNQCQGRS